MLKREELQKKRNFNQSNIVPTLKEAGQTRLAEQIESCGKVSTIATCSKCGTKYYAGTSYCKSRFCSICAKLRALAWLAKLIPLLKHYREQGYMIFFLNLTIKDEESLKSGISHIMESWRIMTHDDKLSRQAFKELNNGGVRSLEVKLGKNSGIWHPHIHSIVLLKSSKPVYQYNAYRMLWEKSVSRAIGKDGKFGSIDIRGLRDRKELSNDNESLIRGVVETFKYITKTNWLYMPLERVNELVEETKGKHFISSWGILYGLNKQVEELLNTTTEEELKDKVCEVCGCDEFYLETVLTDMLSEEIRDFK